MGDAQGNVRLPGFCQQNPSSDPTFSPLSWTLSSAPRKSACCLRSSAQPPPTSPSLHPCRSPEGCPTVVGRPSLACGGCTIPHKHPARVLGSWPCFYQQVTLSRGTRLYGSLLPSISFFHCQVPSPIPSPCPRWFINCFLSTYCRPGPI